MPNPAQPSARQREKQMLEWILRTILQAKTGDQAMRCIGRAEQEIQNALREDDRLNKELGR